jgi:hypothetical protein
VTIKAIPALIKKYPFSAGCASLCFSLTFAFFYRQSEVPELDSIFDAKTNESRRLRGNIINSAQLTEHLETLVLANAAVDKRLMRAADLATNQQYFYKIESESGVKITDLRPGSSSPQTTGQSVNVKGSYAAVPYTCAVQGTYSQLLNFLRKLENGEHFQRIVSTNASIAGGGGDEVDNLVDPVITLVISIEFLGRT